MQQRTGGFSGEEELASAMDARNLNEMSLLDKGLARIIHEVRPGFEKARLAAAPARAKTSPASAAGVNRPEASCGVGKDEGCVCPQGPKPQML